MLKRSNYVQCVISLKGQFMQQRLIELRNMINPKTFTSENVMEVINYIKNFLQEGKVNELKTIIALTKTAYGTIYELAIRFSSIELVEILEENKLLPKSHVSSPQKLAHCAADFKNYYFFRKSIQDPSFRDGLDKDKLLHRVRVDSDKKMVRLLFNYIFYATFNNTYINSLEQIVAYEYDPGHQQAKVKKFQDHLFLLYRASMYDSNSVVSEIPLDCIRTIKNLAF